MISRNRDFLQISSRNYLVNNEPVYYSSNITKFGDSGFRYDTSFIITEQAIYNFYKNAIKRRTPLNKIEAISISTRSSEFVIHISEENDYRLYIQDLRNEIIEVLLFLLCQIKKYFTEFKIYEVDLINLNDIATNRQRAQNHVRVRPSENFAHFWNYLTFQQRERESVDRRAIIRRKTQTLYVNPKIDTNEICLEDFELVKVLGKGAFAKVVLAQKKDTHKFYAIKILKKARIIQENQLQHTLAEKTILQHVNHPFLVGLVYAFQTETKLYFVLEFMIGGEIFHHLRSAGRFSEQRTKFYAVSVILGIGFLHERNYIYRDLKLENLLLDEKGYAVLTDFGLAKFLPIDQKTKTFCGTPDYLAPEVIQESGHNRMADWWSLGVLIYEMMHGVPPFYSPVMNEMYENIINRPVVFNNTVSISANAMNLIVRLLEKDPNRRLGFINDAPEILAHPWFSDINVQMVLDRKLTAPFIPDVQNIEKNFEQQFLNSAVRDSVEHSLPVYDQMKIKDYEKDFEMMNFNKDDIQKRFA